MPSRVFYADIQDRQGEHVIDALGLYFWLGADAQGEAIAAMDREAAALFGPGGRFGRVLFPADGA